MKKLLSVIVLAAMLVTMVCPSFAAVADSHDHSGAKSEAEVYDTLTFTVDDAVASKNAKTVDVDVRIAGNGEHNCPTGIWGLRLSLYYPDALKAVDIKNGTLFPASEAGFEMEKWNASTPDDITAEALEECGVAVGDGYRYGVFATEKSEYTGGCLDNGVLFTVTFELPEGAKAGDVWEIGIVANADDVNDCGVEKVNDEGNTVIEYSNIPFSLDNGSVSVVFSTEIAVADATASVGCEFTVPVVITDNPGMFITRLTAEYDADKLEFVRAENGDVFADGYVITTKVEDGNLTLYFESSDSANVTGDGTLVNLVFKAADDEAAAGETAITLVAEDAVNLEGADIDVTLTAGVVNVLANTLISVGNATVVATEDVEVPVNIALNNGVWGVRAEFKYDASKLTFKGVQSGIFNIVEGENYSEADGVITVFVEGVDVADVAENGALFTLQFTAGRAAGTAAVAVTLLDAVNANEEDITVKTVDGEVEILPAPSLTVGSVDTYAEKLTLVPVTISGNSGVVSVRMEIAYDAANLEFLGVSGALFSADDTNASAKGGVITVFVENDTVADVTEDGVIFYLNFKPLTNEDAAYTLEATVIADSTINADGEEVKFLGENGVVTVTAHEHNFATDVVAPTCTEDGSETVACTICEIIESVTILPALGHTPGEPVVVAATCTENGYTLISCSVCDLPLTKTIMRAAGHNWAVDEVVAPTCIADGYTMYVCSNCGESKSDDITPADPENGHVAGEKVVTAEPTYEADGAYEVRCTICDAVLESGTIPMLSNITVTVGDGSAKPGKELTVPVVYDGNEGTFILRLNVAYDAEKLVYVGAENGEVFASANVLFNKVSDGFIVLYFESNNDTDVTADGVLANLKFRAADGEENVGTTEVTVTVEDAVNLAEDDIYVYPYSGTVTIEPNSTITVNPVSVAATMDVDVPVSIELNDGVWAVRAEFKYDASMLTFKGIKGAMFNAAEGENYSVDNGVITVFVEGADVADATEDGVLFYLQFTANKIGGTTPVDVNLLEVINTESADLDVVGVGGDVEIIPLPAFEIGTVDGYANTTVKVPVTVARNPGVYSVRMEIAYNEADLEFAGVTGGLFSADATNASANGGVVTVYVESDDISNVTGDGVAFYLNFNAKQDFFEGVYVLTGAIIADSTVNADGDEVLCFAEDGKIVMHSHEEHTVVTETTPATCTKDGAEVKKCSVCGEIFSETVIPATGHAWDDGVVVPSTCVDMGYTLYTCTLCGLEQMRNFVAVVDHTPADEPVITAPTCTVDGTKVIKCSVCGETISTEVIPAKGHTEGAPEVVLAPTCSAEGKSVVKCTECGEVLSETAIEKLPHTPGTPRFETIADCTHDGLTKVNCSVCGEALPDIIVPAYGHLYDEDAEPTVIPATCTEEGRIVIVCLACGDEEVIEVLPATDHAWKFVETVPATPTEQGYDLYVCENDETHTEKRNFTEFEGLFGDVNNDGVIDSDDAIYMLYFTQLGAEDYPIVGLETIHHGGDFNNDGMVDSDDAIYLLYYTMYPDEYPLVWKQG